MPLLDLSWNVSKVLSQECKYILDELGWESVDLKKQYDFQLEEKADDAHEHCPVQMYMHLAAFKVALNEQKKSVFEKIHNAKMQMVIAEIHKLFK